MLKFVHAGAWPAGRLTAADWSEAPLAKSPPWLVHATPPLASYQVTPSPVQAPVLESLVPCAQSWVTR